MFFLWYVIVVFLLIMIIVFVLFDVKKVCVGGFVCVCVLLW